MLKEGNILIVDDNKELLVALKLYLSPHFKTVVTEHNPNRIKEHLTKSVFDIIMLDMNFKAGINNGNEGLYWMQEVHKHDPELAVVLITAYSDVELAVKAIKKGAADFIEKSWDERKILSTLRSVFELQKSKRDISRLKKKHKHLKECIETQSDMFIGQSDTMQQIMHMVKKVAPTDVNLLILGENGTGKEVMARTIHQLSARKDEMFVSVDLGAIHENLFESELFGHLKGAFTDAKTDRTGRFELASGGTLFLDEIGNLSMAAQAKLLAALQNREITPVGGTRPIKVDIRLICATNMPLQQMVAEGSFREDLLYRINTIAIELPALRNRKEDIGPLANYFIQKQADKYNKGSLSLTANAIEALKEQSWPGNIRELQHTIEKAVILCDSASICSEDLFLNNHQPKVLDDGCFNLNEHERLLIEKAIANCKGNMSKAAMKLGINRSTLYDKIKKYDL
ncbi:sigma-54-dependent Fis family transcriptional regulator [Carboxylicivirga sediminis]|uniref:Sigma-54-dependent Fis family transcriptional regulator n=1 Tax=Carboxylicivirga sediminis TaxID=2006564 RepID=A0A941F1A3_9BACT|nr:sigma-54 dependent transcriptional regulator [Carboxylicivirga sediminis]MBR8535023.1 sigma-54-dependent Fis family transcriptional regulator [Carboxylicivirga sediminis]